MSYKRKEVIGDCTLYLGDCLDIMPALNKVDAVVTDPPYGIGESAKKNNSRTRLAKPNDYGDFKWDKKPADVKFILDLDIPSIIWGGNYFNVPPSSCWLVWNKLNGNNDFADCELAWTNLKKAVRNINFLWNGMIRHPSESQRRVHPTQKPFEVMKWCISHLPKDCTGTILDPFMGSGTTLVACAKMGRKGIGIEIDEDYFDIACKRVEDAYKQGDLFGY